MTYKQSKSAQNKNNKNETVLQEDIMQLKKLFAVGLAAVMMSSLLKMYTKQV